jgi:hypothetical protein
MSRRANLALFYWSASQHVRECRREQIPMDASDIRDLIHAATVFARSDWPTLRRVAQRNLPVVVTSRSPTGAA